MSIVNQDIIGPYRLLSPIRTGRYTQVWAAIDDVDQEYSAIKMLLPEFRKSREQLQTMRRELEIGRLLDHPRCLGPRELRQTKGGPCLIMKLIRGDNLRDVVKNRRDDLNRMFASIVRQAAEGIAYLNSLGFVHLDIKPDNFILSTSDELFLIDFALARKPPNFLERLLWNPRKQTIQGTRSYMSTEQIRKLPVDFRSDVYSLGCTFYHMAAGVAPYTGASSNELLAKHLYAPVPNVIVDNPLATQAFSNLLRSMLAKRPEDRPRSVGELLPTLSTIRFLRSETEPDDADSPQNMPQTQQNAG
jgi:serine/threonine protein kinase